MTPGQKMLLAAVEWRPIAGFGGAYEVSNYGSVRSLDRIEALRNRWGTVTRRRHPGRILQARRLSGNGYLRVHLRGTDYYIHHLVAAAFIEPASEEREGMDVAHCDGVRANNYAGNLRYVTRPGSMTGQRRRGTHGNAQRQCMRGHRLVGPNIADPSARDGRRYCLACRRAAMTPGSSSSNRAMRIASNEKHLVTMLKSHLGAQ